jgi:hypothetical protein
VAGDWKTLHNVELHNMHSSSNIVMVMHSERMTWAGHVASTEEMRNVYKILIGKPEGKRPIGRSRRRREDNIRIGLRELGWKGVDWIHLAHDRDLWRAGVNTIMNLRVP